jgi:hypothetical protein
MPHILCQYCQSPVAFEALDLGLEVYCHSCGRANLIPAAPASELQPPPPAAPPPVRASSVFSAEGTAAADEEILGEETCLCGFRVPIRVGDVGGVVYCPSCAAEIQVGRSLLRRPALVAGGAVGIQAPGQGGPAVPSQAMPSGNGAGLRSAGSADRGPWVRWFKASRAAILLLVALALVARLAGLHPERLIGMAGTSREAPVDDDGSSEASPEEPTPGPPVTTESIEQLLQSVDRPRCLIQARAWRELLRAQGIAESDPVQVKLVEGIRALEVELAPKPEPPDPRLLEAQKALDAVAGTLARGDLKAARQAATQAETLIGRDADALAPCCRRLLLLKLRLRREEMLSGGADRIRELLERADRDLSAGKLTESLEADSQARFLARIAPLTQAEAADLDRRQRPLASKLRFARGRRAVSDAVDLGKAGDKHARDNEVRRALALLAGFPESEVQTVLGPVRPWVEPARRAGGSAAGQPAASVAARRIGLRNGYETVLASFGDGSCSELLRACRDVEEEFRGDPESAKARAQMESLLFDLLEREVAVGLTSAADGDGPAGKAERLADIRRLLEQAQPWRANPRWRILDSAVRRTPG